MFFLTKLYDFKSILLNFLINPLYNLFFIKDLENLETPIDNSSNDTNIENYHGNHKETQQETQQKFQKEFIIDNEMEKHYIDYELFGLCKETASIKDAKRSYYNLALMIHPDRNQCKDKSVAQKEMIYVTLNYNRIIKEIEKRIYKDNVQESKDLHKLYDVERNAIFNNLNEMPSFSDIFNETRDDLMKFNEKWDNTFQNHEIDVDENDNLSKFFKLKQEVPIYNTVSSNYHNKDMNQLKYDPKPDITKITLLLSEDDRDKYVTNNYSIVPSSIVNDLTKPKNHMCDLDEAFNLNNMHSGYNHKGNKISFHKNIVVEFEKRKSMYKFN